MIQGGKKCHAISDSEFIVGGEQQTDKNLVCGFFSDSDIQRLSSSSSPIFSEINEHKSSNMFPPTQFLTTTPQKILLNILYILLAKMSS